MESIEPTAIKCPVCNGHGTVSNAFKICHGCKGKGYLVVLENKKALRCPVCNGFGSVGSKEYRQQCNSCSGSGYILIDREIQNHQGES